MNYNLKIKPKDLQLGKEKHFNKIIMKKFIDLFADTGAFSHVLENKGWQCVFANDMMESSKEIYKKNHKNAPFVLGDLNEIDINTIPTHDLLCAGFPCQPFSLAGKREGFQDPRSNVFWKILEIMKMHQPSFVLLENVKNLTSHDEGKTFQTIFSSISDLGYYIKYKVLDTSLITSFHIIEKEFISWLFGTKIYLINLNLILSLLIT